MARGRSVVEDEQEPRPEALCCADCDPIVEAPPSLLLIDPLEGSEEPSVLHLICFSPNLHHQSPSYCIEGVEKIVEKDQRRLDAEHLDVHWGVVVMEVLLQDFRGAEVDRSEGEEVED